MNYKEAILRRHPGLSEPQLSKSNTALLVIDMQYYDAHPDYGIVSQLKSREGEPAVQYYIDRLGTIIPNVQRLLIAFREQNMEVIFVRIQSLTKYGRDRSRGHKNHDIHCPPDSKEAQILEEVAPAEDEIVLSKTCGSAFNGTMIDSILRNIGINNLVIVGVVTSGCVEISVRDASDRSYGVILIEDACATWTMEMEVEAIQAMNNISAKVKNTHEVVQIVAEL